MATSYEPDLNLHPCFNAKIKGRYGRVHLPVAPKCNIKCNYCNRKYDCVNESRPGVTSTVLTPGQAVRYVEQVLEKESRISVAGIAGPGDPFANAPATMETLRQVRKRFPQIILCLASNGFALSPYVDELNQIGVSHVTVTINAVDPDVSERIYAWIRDGKVIYRGRKGAELLLARQLDAVQRLKKHGMTVKVNTIVIPGVNDTHVLDVAQKMSQLGVDVLNCMPMYPNAETPFEDIPEPSKSRIAEIRQEAERFIPQMRHCTRCRADAVGLLEEDRTEEFRSCLSACGRLALSPDEDRPYVAVATLEGALVNVHLGEAKTFQIWGQTENGFYLWEERPTPRPGNGRKRWFDLADRLKDCRAILVSAMGETPRTVLTDSGIKPVEMNGFIQVGLRAVYGGDDLDLAGLKGRRQGCTKAGGCGAGSGRGCN
jgi:nitrogen fixation protein NifB